MAKRKRESKATLLAEEEVLLSKERTILSFMRTALALIGVGLVVANFFKDAVFQVIGFGLILIGFVELLESVRKLREKQTMMTRFQKKTKV